MKTVDMLPLKVGLAAASLAVIGIVAVALSSPADEVEVPACTTICAPQPAAPQPLHDIQLTPAKPSPAADY